MYPRCIQQPSRSAEGEDFFSKFNFLWDDPNHGDPAAGSDGGT